MERAERLDHVTASRVKAPKRRPPSAIFLKDNVSIQIISFLSLKNFLEYVHESSYFLQRWALVLKGQIQILRSLSCSITKIWDINFCFVF